MALAPATDGSPLAACRGPWSSRALSGAFGANGRPQVLVHPLAVDAHIVVVVAQHQPLVLIVLAEGERPEEVPAAGGAVAVHLDLRVHHIVLGEADQLLKAAEQLADGVVALGLAEARALPDAVRCEHRGDALGVVVVVADL